MLLLILLHPLHDPLTMMLRKLLRTLLRLHLLLHLELDRHINTLIDRRPLLDRLEPLLQVREGRSLYTCPLGPVYPREAAEVSDGELPTDDPETLVGGLLRSQSVVEDMVEAFCLGVVALDGVVDFFRGVAVEMVCCICHQSK